MSGQTPSQTVGPYFALGLTAEQYGYPHSSIAGNDLVRSDGIHQVITITGQVIDGEGTPIDDAMVEIWQADATGRYPNAGSNTSFAGFGRCGTGLDDANRFSFRTIKPGAPGGGHAPHINVAVLMRGGLNHLFTRIYFPEDSKQHDADQILTAVPAERRHTLIAARDSDNAYRFDIHMQGEQETVFFDV